MKKLLTALSILTAINLSVGHTTTKGTNLHKSLTTNNIEQKQHTGHHKVTHVTITCYQPVRGQCAGNPLVTSDGSHINLAKLKAGKIRWCAVSRDLLYLFPKDKPKRIQITGCPQLNGIWEVRDITNRRFNHRVDILIHPQDNRRFKYKNIKIYILD